MYTYVYVQGFGLPCCGLAMCHEKNMAQVVTGPRRVRKQMEQI